MTARSVARLRRLLEFATRCEVRPGTRSLALLLGRVALAWIFIAHGAGTLFGAFSGPGVHREAVFFASTAHLRPGTFFAVLSGITEFAGGIAVGVGLLARLAAVGLFFDMVLAIVTTTFKDGLITHGLGPGYELNIALAALAAGIVLLGAGRFGIDYVVHGIVWKADGSPRRSRAWPSTRSVLRTGQSPQREGSVPLSDGEALRPADGLTASRLGRSPR